MKPLREATRDKSGFTELENISFHKLFALANIESVSFAGSETESGGGRFITEKEAGEMTKRFAEKIEREGLGPKILLWKRDAVGWKVSGTLLDSLINHSGYSVDTLLIELGKRKYEDKKLYNTLVVTGLTNSTIPGQKPEKNGSYKIKTAHESSLMHNRRNPHGTTNKVVPAPAYIEYVSPCNTCP